MSQLKRGEIWLVNLNPTLGAEINKVRPVIIISSDSIGILPIKLVVPITDWKKHFENNIWHIKIIADSQNNLNKDSTIDVLQIRGVDVQRFQKKIGQVDETILEKITYAIALVIEL